mgnify:CR=1 FL=1
MQIIKIIETAKKKVFADICNKIVPSWMNEFRGLANTKLLSLTKDNNIGPK